MSSIDKLTDQLQRQAGEAKDEKIRAEAERAQNEMAAELLSQVKELHDKTIETNWRLTQHNFFTNAGGAVAILGYMGATQSASFAILPLCFFVVGLIASGIEIRVLYSIYGRLHHDAAERHKKILDDSSKALESAVPNKYVASLLGKLNSWSGIVAQSAFVLGVLSGVLGYLLP